MLELKRIYVSGFKAIDRFSISFEPTLTVLLGMNGAGKSSVLQVLGFARHLAEETPLQFFEERGWDRKALRFKEPTNRSTIIRIAAIFHSHQWGEIRWSIRWGLNTGRLQRERVELLPTASMERVDIVSYDRKTGGRAGRLQLPGLQFKGSLLSAVQSLSLEERESGVVAELFSWLTGIQSLELLSPSAMKGGARLSPGSMGARGDRLAGFLAALRPDQRLRVVNRVAQFYPLENLDTVRKRAGWIDLILSERFSNFGSIDSAYMSDGFMRILALCAIPEYQDISLVLLDEIEDGIEPHFLGRVVSLVTRETRAQIVATSHSPILANVVGPDALRLISRTPDGRSIATEIVDLPAFQLGGDYFGPGELWTNTELQVLEREAQSIATHEYNRAEADDS